MKSNCDNCEWMPICKIPDDQKHKCRANDNSTEMKKLKQKKGIFPNKIFGYDWCDIQVKQQR